jgi:hypothetical protein
LATITFVKHGTRVLAALGLVAALVVACTDDGTPCYPQDYRACDCPGAPHGFQQCTADGQTYGTCDCSGKTPGVPTGDAATADVVSPAVDASNDAGSLLPFMSACGKNEECETGLCFNFPSKGPHCTRSCTQPTDCPPPSLGCNPQSVCKAP